MNAEQEPIRVNTLTNRFHFAVGLYSDNAQMTSKRGENKEVRYEPQASSVTDVRYQGTEPRQNGIYLFIQ